VVLTPLKKYESQLGRIIRIMWKIKNVPNHQPVADLHNHENHQEEGENQEIG
jgi:hypothetical protein